MADCWPAIQQNRWPPNGSLKLRAGRTASLLRVARGGPTSSSPRSSRQDGDKLDQILTSSSLVNYLPRAARRRRRLLLIRDRHKAQLDEGSHFLFRHSEWLRVEINKSLPARLSFCPASAAVTGGGGGGGGCSGGSCSSGGVSQV